MAYDRERLLAYWNRQEVQSMYDKHLLGAEIELLRSRVPAGSKLLDAGCGEGEATAAYAELPGVVVHGADFSDTRLALAAERLRGRANVSLRRVDLLDPRGLDADYDVVVSQRFLINLTDRSLQERALGTLAACLNPRGRLLLLEGSRDGEAELNALRAALGLPSLAPRWHNLFLDDAALVEHMATLGCRLLEQDGLGPYFLLTRGVRPCFDAQLDWDCEYNRRAALRETRELLGSPTRFSRLKLWVFGAPGAH